MRRLFLAAEIKSIENPVHVDWEEQYTFDQLEG
jgi:hypothetical protein